MTPTQSTLALEIADRLLARNRIFEDFFAQEAPRLAAVSQEMAERFLRGGQLLAFGRGACATDAQHVSVEFVHPVIVGKRALPALDISAEFALWLDALVRPDDIVMGFAPPEGDAEVQAALDAAHLRNAMTLGFPVVTDDAFIHQELIEVLYHTLWETVHVFLEHRELGQDTGPAGFLYPFLGQNKHDSASLRKEVAESIRMKVRDDARLRAQIAEEQSEQIAATAIAIHGRLQRGGKLILFGNGGSATDANACTRYQASGQARAASSALAVSTGASCPARRRPITEAREAGTAADLVPARGADLRVEDFHAIGRWRLSRFYNLCHGCSVYLAFQRGKRR